MVLLKKTRQRVIDMTQGPILSNLLLFSVPMMISGVLQLLFNAADISIAGQYIGDHEMGAIGATGTLINLLVNLFVGLSVGFTVLLGQAYGSGQQQTVSRVVHTSVILAAIWGAAVSAISFFGAEFLLGLMKVPREMLPMAVRYLRIYACGMIGSSLYNFGSAVLRATGDSKRPLYCLAVSSGLNFGLNQLFVRVFHMGLEGVAWSTAISLWVMGLLTLVCMVINKGQAQLSLRNLRLHGKTLKKILGLGIPAGLQGIFFPLSNIVLQTYINAFGPVVIAANSAACNVESFVYQALIGFYHGCLAFVSCNAGAHNWKRVKEVFVKSLIAVAVTGVVLGVGMVIFGKPLLGIYTGNPDIVKQGLLRFLFTGLPYFLCGMMEVVVGALRGLGASVRPMIVSVLGVCGVRILCALIVAPFHKVELLYLSYPLSWLVTLIAQSVLLLILAKAIRKKERLQ